jgi:hypothetical protein
MPLSDIISMTISVQTLTVAQAGFGVPLILSHTANWVERTRSYTSDTAVLTDFASTTPEYKAAVKLFSQDPKPEKIMIGRAVNKPTQRWGIRVTQVLNNTAYVVYVNGVPASFTSDANATNDEIITGVNAAITALVTSKPAPSTTGTTGTITSVLTAAAPGDWHSIAVGDVNLLAIDQDHAEPGLAADLSAIKNENNSWYALVTLYNSKAYIQAAAAWVESNGKLYGPTSQDTAIITTAYANGSATDVATALRTSAYARTFVSYHPDNGAFLDAAWMGKCLPMAPGSETWKFKTLATVPATSFTGTHQANLADKRCNYYYEVAGVNMTTEGIVSAGEFVDVVRFRDWLQARMMERIFARLVQLKKVSFTDAGVAIIEAEVRAQLSEGIEVGGLSDDPAPQVQVPRVANVSSADKGARRLTGIKFRAVLAGAIHSLVIEGTITL